MVVGVPIGAVRRCQQFLYNGRIRRRLDGGSSASVIVVVPIACSKKRRVARPSRWLEEAFQLVDEGKFGEDGPIDQAATDAWADKWEDEYRLA